MVLAGDEEDYTQNFHYQCLHLNVFPLYYNSNSNILFQFDLTPYYYNSFPHLYFLLLSRNEVYLFLGEYLSYLSCIMSGLACFRFGLNNFALFFLVFCSVFRFNFCGHTLFFIDSFQC